MPCLLVRRNGDLFFQRALFPEKWVLKIQLKEFRVTFNVLNVGIKMSLSLSCSEGKPSSGREKSPEAMRWICPGFVCNLLDATHISAFVASWDFMEDNSQVR